MAKPIDVPVDPQGFSEFAIEDGPNLHQIMDVIGAPIREWCTRSVTFFVKFPAEVSGRKTVVTIGVQVVPVELCRVGDESFNLGCASVRQEGIKFGRVDFDIPLLEVMNYSTRHRGGVVRMTPALYALCVQSLG